jgi:hypothetical protein
MAKVKGVLVIPLVKAIRADKSGKLRNHLTAVELTIIDSTFYPITWMDFETYQRVADVVARENAMNDEKTIQNWGYASATNTLKPYQGNFVIKGSLKKTIDEYLVMSKTFFDFGQFEATVIEKGHAQIRVHGFPDDFKVFYHLIRGWFTKIFELAGANDVKSKYVSKTWEGAPDTIVEYRWL